MAVAALPIILLAVGTAAAVGGAVYSAQQAQKAGKQQAAIAQRNAVIATQAAQADAEDTRRRARYMLGTQLARAGASGVELEGSPLMVMLDSAAESELEVQRRLYAGQLQALGYTEQADRARWEANQMATAQYIGAGTTLLTSGMTYSRWQAEDEAWQAGRARAGSSLMGR